MTNEQIIQQLQQFAGVWVKAETDLPKKAGRYFVITHEGKKRTCLFYTTTQTFTTNVLAWLNESASPAEDLKAALLEMVKENEQLRQWKKEAIAVMPDYKKISKLIGVPLGESVHDKIIPYLLKGSQ